MFSRKIQYTGGESCFLQLRQMGRVLALVTPCCKTRQPQGCATSFTVLVRSTKHLGREETKKEAGDILGFVQGMKATQLSGIPSVFLLHLYFTCETDRVNDNKQFSFKSWQGEVLFP